jgi:riboflavin kinase/FMN adenylyltransferase
MHVFSGVKHLAGPIPGSVVTIGNFDGVHLGHQQLIQTVVREAQYYGIPSVVFTFEPHPGKVFHPERPTLRLFDSQDQKEQLEGFGVDKVILEPFNFEFSKMSPSDFLDNYISRQLNPKTLVVGHDFSFGAGRAGNLQFLEEYCSKKGIRLIIIPPFYFNQTIVSSSQIRRNLLAGEVEIANALLGRAYYFRGTVEKGFQRGRTIGVPTANISPDIEFTPRKGVYCTETLIGNHFHRSVTNIGNNPTFQIGNPLKYKIETHLLNFDASLYGIEVKVHLQHFLREELKFSGAEQLKAQILSDIKNAQRFFDEQDKNR